MTEEPARPSTGADHDVGSRVATFSRGTDFAWAVAVLEERRDEVLARWLEAAAAQPFHADQPERVVADHIPPLYDAVLEFLRSYGAPNGSPATALEDTAVLNAAKAHAGARFGQKLKADAILTEFRLLRQEVGRCLRYHIRDEVPASDLVGAELVIHDALDGAVFLALGAYNQYEEELRASEEARRRSEERLRLLVDNIRDYAIYSMDSDGRVNSWNTGAERIQGYRQEEVLGRSYDEFFTPEDRAEGRPARLLHRARIQGRAEDAGWRVRKDGTRYWADVILNALYDGQGRLLGYAKVARDATARRRVEEEERLLSDATRELSSSLDYEVTLQRVARLSVPRIADWCGIDLLDDEGRLRRLAVAHVDPARASLMQALHDRCPPDESRNIGIGQVLRTGEPVLYAEVSDELLERAARDPEHLRLLRQAGFASAMIVPLVARQRILGTLTFVSMESRRRYGAHDLAFVQDLARHAALAIDNARLYRKLQQEVQAHVQLNAALTEAATARDRLLERERAALAEAEEARRNLQAFLGMIAHDLRSPLSTVMGYIRILQQQEPAERPETQAAALAAMHRQAQRMNDLIAHLLDATSIGAGGFEVQRERTNLGALVRRAADAAQAKSERHRLETDAPDELVALVDPRRIWQVLDNLLDNAIKYSPEGGEIDVRLRTEGETAVISVSDRGVGMEPGEMAELFQLFSRLTSGRHAPGTGLGLYITRGIVAAHGGRIEAISEGPGRGSTFVVRLPTGATAT